MSKFNLFKVYQVKQVLEAIDKIEGIEIDIWMQIDKVWENCESVSLEGSNIAFLALVRYTRRGTALPCPYTSRYDIVLSNLSTLELQPSI
ncbi:MAG: hypothetical protein HEQ35_08250 [Gloeotrichia echinulata IR180]